MQKTCQARDFIKHLALWCFRCNTLYPGVVLVDTVCNINAVVYTILTIFIASLQFS